MNKLSYEKVLFIVLVGLSVAGFQPAYTTLAALAVITLDILNIIIEDKKSTRLSKEELKRLTTKLDSLEKTTTDRISQMENKLAGVGIVRRNA